MRFIGVLLTLSIPSLAAAQAVTFVDVDGAAAPTDKTIIVVGQDGSRLTAKLADTSATSAVVMARAANGAFSDRKEIPASAIHHIERPDPLWNGALIGFLLAAIPSLLDGSPDGAVIGGGVCAAFGLAVDAYIPAHKYFAAPRTRLTTSISPMVGSGRAGAFLSVRF